MLSVDNVVRAFNDSLGARTRDVDNCSKGKYGTERPRHIAQTCTDARMLPLRSADVTLDDNCMSVETAAIQVRQIAA
jgi:hypothetical protein